MTDQEETEIPLPNVKGSVIRKILTYLQHHLHEPAAEIEKPLKSAIMTEVVSAWDAAFIEVDQELLFGLLLVGSILASTRGFVLCS